MGGSQSNDDSLARLAELEGRFQKALEAEKLEAMAEFAAGAGHEINNPLTVISGRAQLLLRGESDPERRHALALISAQAMRVFEMIADMMLFARPPKPEFAQCDIAALLERAMGDFRAAAQRQDTRLEYVGSTGPISIMADATQVAVAVRALFQNALEALGNGGQIEISLESSPSEVHVRVCDNGPGITADERRHIFDPFYSARQAGRGLGLGLSKAWRIATQHNGRIDVASEPGHGAKFTLVLPVLQPVLE